MNNKSGSTAAARWCLLLPSHDSSARRTSLQFPDLLVRFLHISVPARPHTVTSTEERKFTNRIEAAARHLAEKKT